MCFSQGFFQKALSINHTQSLGPKLPNPHLLIVLHCNGFAMLLKYWVYFVYSSIMLLCWRSLNKREDTLFSVECSLDIQLIEEVCCRTVICTSLHGKCSLYLTLWCAAALTDSPHMSLLFPSAQHLQWDEHMYHLSDVPRHNPPPLWVDCLG